MSAAQPRRKIADPAVSTAPGMAVPEAQHASALPPPSARLIDELAVPAASPVHQLQAELLQLTQPEEPQAEELYPGWFRLAFPIASSAFLWAAILWGASHFA
ncbi:hypothetical protein NSE01_16290 [Novosphingobium sediminis]|uniref:Uncharacterized protein n=1 Tax=Novosphingobium sediminis TaxID=707214 RepID=A0A512AJE3_9SPHN|nr:hypothetical protein [Novosphingobium sediminis]GEN99796.1 hypothetical protein NSE01_16290 [Novosphingobium sediminis]